MCKLSENSFLRKSTTKLYFEQNNEFANGVRTGLLKGKCRKTDSFLGKIGAESVLCPPFRMQRLVDAVR